MKIVIIFIGLLLVTAPYVLNRDISRIKSVGVTTAQQERSCAQKSTNLVRSNCQGGPTYGIPACWDTYVKLPLQFSLFLFFIYLLAVCAGFKTLIYKPPQYHF